MAYRGAAYPELTRAMRIPHAEAGMSIGLFGGSFNPPHAGHLLVAETALVRARLDRIWWMVSPANPLKRNEEPVALANRLALSADLVRHPRIAVTALEAQFGTRYTDETLHRLMRLRPRLRFVWLMGADSLAEFHRWHNWRCIAEMVPMIVVDRPGATMAAVSAPAAVALARYRLDEADAPRIARLDPPAWTFLHVPKSHLSSTRLRRDDRRRP